MPHSSRHASGIRERQRHAHRHLPDASPDTWSRGRARAHHRQPRGPASTPESQPPQRRRFWERRRRAGLRLGWAGCWRLSSPWMAERLRGSGRQTPRRHRTQLRHPRRSLWHHLHDADEVLSALARVLLQRLEASGLFGQARIARPRVQRRQIHCRLVVLRLQRQRLLKRLLRRLIFSGPGLKQPELRPGIRVRAVRIDRSLDAATCFGDVVRLPAMRARK